MYVNDDGQLITELQSALIEFQSFDIAYFQDNYIDSFFQSFKFLCRNCEDLNLHITALSYCTYFIEFFNTNFYLLNYSFVIKNALKALTEQFDVVIPHLTEIIKYSNSDICEYAAHIILDSQYPYITLIANDRLGNFLYFLTEIFKKTEIPHICCPHLQLIIKDISRRNLESHYTYIIDLISYLINTENFDSRLIHTILTDLLKCQLDDLGILKIKNIIFILYDSVNIDDYVQELILIEDTDLAINFITIILSNKTTDDNFSLFCAILMHFITFSPYIIKKTIKREVSKSLNDDYLEYKDTEEFQSLINEMKEIE